MAKKAKPKVLKPGVVPREHLPMGTAEDMERYLSERNGPTTVLGKVKWSSVTTNRMKRAEWCRRDLVKARAMFDSARKATLNSVALDFEKAGFGMGRKVRVPHPGTGEFVVAVICGYEVLGSDPGVPMLRLALGSLRFLADQESVVLYRLNQGISEAEYVRRKDKAKVFGIHYGTEGGLEHRQVVSQAAAEKLLAEFRFPMSEGAALAAIEKRARVSNRCECGVPRGDDTPAGHKYRMAKKKRGQRA